MLHQFEGKSRRNNLGKRRAAKIPNAPGSLLLIHEVTVSEPPLPLLENYHSLYGIKAELCRKSAFRTSDCLNIFSKVSILQKHKD